MYRLLAVSVVALSALFPAVVAAETDGGDTAETVTAETVTAGTDKDDTAKDKMLILPAVVAPLPPTLSEAMVRFYAASSQSTLQEFAARNSDVFTAFGLDPGRFQTSFTGNELAGASDPFAALRERAASPLPTLEQAVVLSGASWGASLAEWATSPRELPVPVLGALPTPSVAVALPPEGFGTGMMLERSLSSLVSSHPEVFAQVRSTGLGTEAAGQAWRESMLNAYNATNADRSLSLIDPCSASFLGAMASGSAATGRSIGGDRCNPCVVAGIYVHGQMGRLFDPGSTSTLFDPSDGVMPPAEWDSLPEWQRQVLINQNPSLSEQLSSSMSRSSTTGSCASASAVIDKAAPSVLPGIWSNIGK
jgi:hypothetical protein